jgi:hypothetical protein
VVVFNVGGHLSLERSSSASAHPLKAEGNVRPGQSFGLLLCVSFFQMRRKVGRRRPERLKHTFDGIEANRDEAGESRLLSQEEVGGEMLCRRKSIQRR